MTQTNRCGGVPGGQRSRFLTLLTLQLPEAAPKKVKQGPREREVAVEIRSKPVEEQRAFLSAELKSVVSGAVSLPEGAVVSTPTGESFGDRLLEAAEAAQKGLWEKVRQPGKERKSVAVLVVAAGGMRCAELVREVRTAAEKAAAGGSSGKTKKKKKSQTAGAVPAVAKLWAKHMKVEEQTAHLATHYAGAGCGTPNRIAKLVEAGGLELGGTRLLAIDCQPSVKGQTVFSLPETKADLMALLAAHCLDALVDGSLKIVLL